MNGSSKKDESFFLSLFFCWLSDFCNMGVQVYKQRKKPPIKEVNVSLLGLFRYRKRIPSCLLKVCFSFGGILAKVPLSHRSKRLGFHPKWQERIGHALSRIVPVPLFPSLPWTCFWEKEIQTAYPSPWISALWWIRSRNRLEVMSHSDIYRRNPPPKGTYRLQWDEGNFAYRNGRCTAHGRRIHPNGSHRYSSWVPDRTWSTRIDRWWR